MAADYRDEDITLSSSVSFGVESNHSTFDMAILMKRPMQTRMQGVVGAGREKPPATRFGIITFHN